MFEQYEGITSEKFSTVDLPPCLPVALTRETASFSVCGTSSLSYSAHTEVEVCVCVPEKQCAECQFWRSVVMVARQREDPSCH